jgi:hypothetical protein
MSEQDSRLRPSPREVAEAQGDRIRDAAKWLVASFAAVGAALIAGSQLSSIGKLPVCWHLSLECTRLGWAILGAIAGLAGVVWAIWTAVMLLVPNNLPPSALQKEWKKGDKSALFRYFHDNPAYLQGYEDFADLDAREKEAYAKRDALSDEFDRTPEDQRAEVVGEIEAADEEIQDFLDRSEAAIAYANLVLLNDQFRSKALRTLLLAAVIAGLGISVFAWAANPAASIPTPTTRLERAQLSGADLEGAHLVGVDLQSSNLTNAKLTNATLIRADLRGADLSGADLSGANLSGADLAGATLVNVKWSGTVCPDARISDEVGGSCLSHLVAVG